ncbi:MAG TPA: glycosyltransferase family 2 protein [Thermoanaerobaculia bacterium]|nr:glycosyltransferase family 2 protein [Thermoanaerobaculia bacterium]
MSSRVLAVVPTLGESDLLGACLESIATQDPPCESLVLWQGPDSRPRSMQAEELRSARIVRLAQNRGFAGGVNAALREVDAARVGYVAVVNDDVVLGAGWLARLVDALDEDERLGSVQGVNLVLPRDSAPPAAGIAGNVGATRIDGVGLAWNRWWQAVQLLHDRPAAAAPKEAREVYGVAATAAVYRRAALERSAKAPGEVLDETLFAYYEDVDLAGRLRRDGYSAAMVPEAVALHRGSATGLLMPHQRWAWIYGNRWLVVARLLGRSFPRAVPRMLLRDLRDLARSLGSRSDRGRASGIGRGLVRAARLLPRYARRGPPLLARAELDRLGAERWEQERSGRSNGNSG